MTSKPSTDPSKVPQGHAFAIQWTALGIAGLLLVITLGLLIRWGHQSVLSEETNQLSQRAALVSDALETQLRGINLGLETLVSTIQSEPRRAEPGSAIHHELELVVRLSEAVNEIVFTNRAGRILLASQPALMGRSLNGLDLDQLFRSNISPEVLRVGALFSGPTEERRMALGKPVLGADGKLIGYLIALIDPAFWRPLINNGLYASSMQGLLVHQDGIVLVSTAEHQPLQSDDLAQSIDSTVANFQRRGYLQQVGLGRITSDADEVLLALQRVRTRGFSLDSPPTIVLARAPAEVLENWRVMTSAVVAFAVLVVFASSGALLAYQRRRRFSSDYWGDLNREREDAFSKLAESEERFRTMFLKLPVAYFALDPDGVLIDANRQTMQLLKIDSLARLFDHPFVDLWEQEFSTRFGGSFERFRQESGSICEMTLLRTDGEPVSVVAAFSEDREFDGELRRIHGVLFDITERRAMEERVTRLNADLEAKVSARTAALAQANDLLRELARRDALTGLANRLAGTETLQVSFAELRTGGSPYAVLLIDVDHFKNINDTFGHPAGDEVLKNLARTLQSLLRRSDFLARFGGEEFLAILRDTDLVAARMVAEKLRVAVADAVHEEVGPITISIGLAMAGREDADERVAVKRADERLYQAKEGGRNRVVAPG